MMLRLLNAVSNRVTVSRDEPMGNVFLREHLFDARGFSAAFE